MNKFEELCQTASDTNVDIIDYPFTSKRIKGLYCDGTIALSKDMYIETEKACVLAEELGHHYTTVGDIIDQIEISFHGMPKYEPVFPVSYFRILSDL